jgi:hypothetical protein
LGSGLGLPAGWLAVDVQPKLLHTLFNRLLGQDLDFEKIEPLSPAEVAGTLSTPAERQELIHLMVAIEILSNPIPERLERSVVQWATALHVHERALLYARDLARGELTKALHDFYRMSWIGDWIGDHQSSKRCYDKAYALKHRLPSIRVKPSLSFKAEAREEPEMDM